MCKYRMPNANECVLRWERTEMVSQSVLMAMQMCVVVKYRLVHSFHWCVLVVVRKEKCSIFRHDFYPWFLVCWRRQEKENRSVGCCVANVQIKRVIPSELFTHVSCTHSMTYTKKQSTAIQLNRSLARTQNTAKFGISSKFFHVFLIFCFVSFFDFHYNRR